MHIDIPTLVIILGITHLLQLLIFSHQYKVNKNYRGTGWWLMWCVAESIGFGAMFFRNIPSLFSLVVIIQNFMIVGGTVFLYIGIRKFFDMKVNMRLLIPIVTVFFAGFLFFLFIDNNIQIRSIIIDSTLAMISFLTALTLFANKYRNIRASAYFNASVFLLHSGIFMFINVINITHFSVENIFTPTFFNILSFLDALIVGLLWTFGIIIMLNQRLYADLSDSQKVVQENESQFRSLFENMSEGVALHEMIHNENGIAADYRILDVNRAFEKITGISGLRAKGTLASELYGTGTAPYLTEFNEVILTGKSFSFETYFKEMNKDFSISVTLFKPGYFATIFMDITQRKKSEAEAQTMAEIAENSRQDILSILEDEMQVHQELIDSEEKFSVSFMTSPYAISISRPDNGQFIEINDAFCTISGFTREETLNDFSIGMNLWVNIEDRNRVVANLLNRVIVTGEEFKFKSKNGEIITGLFSAQLIQIKNNPYILSSINDISKRKLAENDLVKLKESLEQRVIERTEQINLANQELEAFSYSVSHDLRAPLRAIDGFTNILFDEYKPKFDDEGKRLCSMIQKNTRHMGQLIDDLLAFSRLGRIGVNAVRINMKKLAYSVYNDITTPERRQQIDFQLGELDFVQGDQNLLCEVWTNLISNAIKFSSHRERSVIKISSARSQNKVTFTIEDNGAGFNMKYSSRLFGVFQRLHSIKEFEGTGVGLAIVQRIISRHGGEVWAKGEVDKGASFYFSLPNG
jgi:PAS domain S-box-containing protein